MKRLFIAVVAIFCGCMGLLSVAQPVMATVHCPAGSVQGGATGKDVDLKSIAQCNMKDTNADTAMTTANTIINVVLGVLGLAAVVMIIIGGISYTTSQGDAAKASKAKNTILYGIVGLIIALLAFPIVNFVLSGVFG